MRKREIGGETENMTWFFSRSKKWNNEIRFVHSLLKQWVCKLLTLKD